MKQTIIRIFANALVGAAASALSVWLGASAGEAVAAGSAGSASVGDFATNVVTGLVDAVSSAVA